VALDAYMEGQRLGKDGGAGRDCGARASEVSQEMNVGREGRETSSSSHPAQPSLYCCSAPSFRFSQILGVTVGEFCASLQ
jgi:hypothetical protein